VALDRSNAVTEQGSNNRVFATGINSLARAGFGTDGNTALAACGGTADAVAGGQTIVDRGSCG
jgi:hypothetical protein